MGEGIAIGIGQTIAAARAVALVRPEDARLALRAVVCSSRADLERFDALWGEEPLIPPAAAAALPRSPGDPAPPGDQLAEDAEMRPSAWSPVELLRDRDLAELDPEELARARALLRNLGRRGPTRVSRRVRPSPRRGPRPDLPRTVRAAMRHGGEPVQRRWRAPGRTPRTLVFVVDVSGSMAAYADALLAYVEGAVVARRRVEAFALGTRLTHVTHELRVGGVARVREAVADWAGGTRIGEGLATLTRRYGGRVGRGAVVVVLSDGWDRGEPELVAAEMERLHRVAHRVVWLNPLKARPGYEPLARGMAAALPFVDDFLAGHSLGAMEELATRLEAAG